MKGACRGNALLCHSSVSFLTAWPSEMILLRTSLVPSPGLTALTLISLFAPPVNTESETAVVNVTYSNREQTRQ